MKSLENTVSMLINWENLANTPLDNYDSWPHALKNAFNTCISSPHPLMLFWGESNRFFCSDACMRFLDVPEAYPVMGLPASDILAGTWKRLEPVLKEVIRTGRPAQVSGIEMKRKDATFGTENTVNISARMVPLLSRSGADGVLMFAEPEVHGYLLSDKEKLNGSNPTPGRSEHVLSQLLRINTVGILFFDNSGKFLDANDTFLRMIGYSRQILDSGKLNTAHVSLPEWMPRTLKVLEELQQYGYFNPYEKELIRPDGSRWWGLFAGTRIGDNEFIEIVLDVTEKKNVEQKLTEAKNSAEKALKAKDEFLSVMSHELRTPLSAIVGLTNLLIKNSPREDQRSYLTSLRISSRNMLSLINEILDFSKIEAGKMDVSTEDFELRNFLLEIENIHRVNAVDKGLDLRVVLAEDLPAYIDTDRVKLMRILDNLINNAIKFTNEGIVELEVRNAGRKGNTILLDFAISDTGIGIPHEKMEYIFEKFTQADGSTTRKYGGTGLGLAITRNMLKLLNSEISVESLEGSGSRFHFRLPVQEGTKTPDTIVAEDKPDAITVEAKILIAEDADINRMIIGQFIKDWCVVEPDEATNGKEAVEMALLNHYDIILMDLRMPEMNGFEATRTIREQHVNTKIPIIALTANTVGEIRKNHEAALFDDVLTKPFEPEELRDLIQKHVSAEEGAKIDRTEQRSRKRQIDFSLIETQFKGNEEKLRHFYQSTLDHLVKYRQQFTRSLQENDVEEFRNMQHNITMLVNLFKLDALNQFLQDIRDQLQNSDAQIQDTAIAKGEELFTTAISNLQQKV